MVTPTMTSKEVCAALHITRKTLYAMEKNGELPFIRIGERKKLYREEDINNLINEKLIKY